MNLELEDKVKHIIHVKLGVDKARVVDSANFVKDLGADSLDQVEVIMALEQEFTIDIPDNAAEKILTVSDALAYIRNQLEKAN